MGSGRGYSWSFVQTDSYSRGQCDVVHRYGDGGSGVFISGFDRPAELKRDEDRMSLASDEEDWDEEAVGEKEAGNLPEAVQGGVAQPVVSGGGVSQPIVVGGPVVVGGNGGAPLSGAAATVNPEVSGAAGGGTQGVQGSVGQQALDIKALADMVNASNAELLPKCLKMPATLLLPK